MKVLIAGDWHSDLHEEEVQRSLRRLGHTVAAFKWHGYFSSPAQGDWLGRVVRRAQDKYLLGPRMGRIQRDFIAQAQAFAPDMIFVYRGTHIGASTLKAIRAALPGCVLLGYNNDDPFSPTQPRYYWRHFMAAIPHYDLMLAYRTANLADLRQAGARRVELLRSWYVPERNHAQHLTPDEQARFGCDVAFIGHYEPDQRLDHLEEIARQGFSLRLFGPTKYWEAPLRSSAVLAPLAPVRMVWGADYNRALCGAKIALCFLSKLNRDTYTRRCFEIPAAGTLMLSEYSDDLAALYAEGAEVAFFRNRDEMMQKIRTYLADEPLRQAVAAAGHRKVRAAGHDIDSRMQHMLEWVGQARQQKEVV